MDVLLRIYGQISKSTLDFLVHNSVVFALLAERNLGPKPFGMYHDGRVEEFIKVGSDLATARKDIFCSYLSRQIIIPSKSCYQSNI